MDPLLLRHRSVGQFHITCFASIQKKKEWKKNPLPECSPYTACSTYVFVCTVT